MAQLLEHSQVVANRKVLDNLRLLQPEAMDALDREFSAIGSQRRPVQRRDHGKPFGVPATSDGENGSCRSRTPATTDYCWQRAVPTLWRCL
jgi:hypothetical protein